ncbi:unnamed protein product, partial [Porites lobata]
AIQSGDGEPTAKNPRKEHRCDTCAHKKCIAERTFSRNTCGESFQSRACFNASHQQQPSKNRKRSATTSNDTLGAKRARKSADPGTRPAASQASAATAGSSWEADPVHISTNPVSSSDEDVAQTVNVCRNVPGYQAPKCFVTDGDPKALITEFIQYLISISTKSSSLLRQQYTEVSEALKTARALNNSESHQLAQILVDIQEGQQTESEEGEFEDDT